MIQRERQYLYQYAIFAQKKVEIPKIDFENLLYVF